MADTVQDEGDGLGSGIFGEPADAANAGEPEGDGGGKDEKDPAVDEESLRIQEYIDKYKNSDGGVDLEKLAKEAMNAQKLIGQKGQEIGQLRKQADDLNNLIQYVNADPKRLKAWNKLLAGEAEDGADDRPAVTSSEDLDKRLIEDMRAGKISASILTVVKQYLQSAGLMDEVKKVKQTLEKSQAEQARAARDAAACAFLADLESKGWTQKVPGKGHYFKDAELDGKFVELYNQGLEPLYAFAAAKEILGITEAPKKDSGKKKAAMLGSGTAKTSRSSDVEDAGGDEWAALKAGFEQEFGPDITKART